MTLKFGTAALRPGATIPPISRGHLPDATINGAASLIETASTFPYLQYLIHKIPLTASTGVTHSVGASLVSGPGKFN